MSKHLPFTITSCMVLGMVRAGPGQQSDPSAHEGAAEPHRLGQNGIQSAAYHIRRRGIGVGALVEIEPWEKDLRSHLEMRLKSVDMAADPEPLSGACGAGHEMRRPLRELETVVMPLHEADRARKILQQRVASRLPGQLDRNETEFGGGAGKDGGTEGARHELGAQTDAENRPVPGGEIADQFE